MKYLTSLFLGLALTGCGTPLPRNTGFANAPQLSHPQVSYGDPVTGGSGGGPGLGGAGGGGEGGEGRLTGGDPRTSGAGRGPGANWRPSAQPWQIRPGSDPGETVQYVEFRSPQAVPSNVRFTVVSPVSGMLLVVGNAQAKFDPDRIADLANQGVYLFTNGRLSGSDRAFWPKADSGNFHNSATVMVPVQGGKRYEIELRIITGVDGVESSWDRSQGWQPKSLSLSAMVL